MITTYWNLFWTTGMPEAWLMSRNGEGLRQAGPKSKPGVEERLSGPLAGFQPRSDNSPGGPMGLY